MAEINHREAVARLLLARGIRYTIKDAPFLYRLFRLNRLKIGQLKAGTIITISQLIDQHQLDDISQPQEVNQKLDVVARIVAVAVLNKKKRISWFSDRLAKILLWKLPAEVLTQIYFNIATVNRITDFMIITIYFAHQSQMMMSPKNLGQADKGS